MRRDITIAENSTDDVAEDSGVSISSNASTIIDQNLEPYDLVMKSWLHLSNAITNFAVEHGGENDLRKVWENLEILVDSHKINEAEKGAVRDLQKARNSIRRLQEVDAESAQRFSETARKLVRIFEEKSVS